MTDRNGLVYGMPDHEYHAGPELSSTGARQILDSPARYQWKQQHPTTSAAFDLGTAVHSQVLGVGVQVRVVNADSWRSKAAQAERDEARAGGFVPLLAADYDTVTAITEAVLAHPGARSIFEQEGAAEVSAFATDPETKVQCRARFDFLPAMPNVTGIAADLKTTSGSASRTGFGVEAAKYGYPIQDAWYTDTLQWITGSPNPIRMAFIVVEKTPPHLVAVHEFDDVTRMAARELAAKARRIYAECTATNTWPGYSDDVITTDIPTWWFNRIDEDQEEMVI